MGDRIPVLEVGGTHVVAAWVSASDRSRAEVRGRREIDGRSGADELIGSIAAAADTLSAPAGLHWGAAFPGPFDYPAGIARFSGVGKFESLNGVDVRARVTEAMSRPPAAISFVNDADAFLIGECWAGVARSVRRCIGITLGTGVGSAFVADGRPVDGGDRVPPDGEVHLLRYGGRPLEDSVSRRAIRRRYAALAGLPAGRPDLPDVREIAERARGGDPAATEVFDTAFAVLGRVLGPWVRRFGAELVVLGGSISRSPDLILPPLHRGLAETGDVEVRLSDDAASSALIGAAYPVLAAQGRLAAAGEPTA